MTSIGIFIGTYGDEKWAELALERAFPSAKATKPDLLVMAHGESLQDVRNGALADFDTDWLIFLDADDELDEAYVREMRRKVDTLAPGHYVIQPATVTIRGGRQVGTPKLIPPKPTLWEGNHCVIGSMFPTALFHQVGGFDDWPAWEDWGLWLKCLKAGARFTACPEAVYRIHEEDREHRNRIEPGYAQRLFQEMVDHYRQWEPR